MKNPDSDSLLFFIWDNYIKSFECKESLIESTDQILSRTDKKEIIRSNPAFYNLFQKIFFERKATLIKNATINGNKADITYHPRYGWVLKHKEQYVHLGKSNFTNKIKLELGDSSYLSSLNNLIGPGKLKIGRFTSIAENFTANCNQINHEISKTLLLGNAINYRFNSHNIEFNATNSYELDITIKNDCWIGRGVKLYPGTYISDGCIIAEDSIVKGHCEPFGIYAGKIAKLKKFRFSEKIIESLLDLKWWDWDIETLKKHQYFLNTDLNEIDELKAIELIQDLKESYRA